jgi:hypothetical protein
MIFKDNLANYQNVKKQSSKVQGTRFELQFTGSTMIDIMLKYRKNEIFCCVFLSSIVCLSIVLL